MSSVHLMRPERAPSLILWRRAQGAKLGRGRMVWSLCRHEDLLGAGRSAHLWKEWRRGEHLHAAATSSSGVGGWGMGGGGRAHTPPPAPDLTLMTEHRTAALPGRRAVPDEGGTQRGNRRRSRIRPIDEKRGWRAAIRRNQAQSGYYGSPRHLTSHSGDVPSCPGRRAITRSTSRNAGL